MYRCLYHGIHLLTLFLLAQTLLRTQYVAVEGMKGFDREQGEYLGIFAWEVVIGDVGEFGSDCCTIVTITDYVEIEALNARLNFTRIALYDVTNSWE